VVLIQSSYSKTFDRVKAVKFLFKFLCKEIFDKKDAGLYLFIAENR
jgi:hypothetical protein